MGQKRKWGGGGGWGGGVGSVEKAQRIVLDTCFSLADRLRAQMHAASKNILHQWTGWVGNHSNCSESAHSPTPLHATPPKTDFVPYGNWGGFDKTEMTGNTTRNFLGPGAAGSGRTELRNFNCSWFLTFLEGSFMTKYIQTAPRISPKARGFWLKEPSAKIRFG